MDARRSVGAALRAKDPHAEKEARNQVHRMKVALGERGAPWWEQTLEERARRWEAGLLLLPPLAPGNNSPDEQANRPS